jgi:hypothetical protein
MQRAAKALAVVAVLFGLATVASGGRALFGGEQARVAVGDAVPFVLWFNFVAGFAYAAAGLAMLAGRRWAVPLSIALAATTAGVLVAFGVHVLAAGAYETRTVGAMLLRSVFWIGVALVWTRAARPRRSAQPVA